MLKFFFPDVDVYVQVTGKSTLPITVNMKKCTIYKLKLLVVEEFKLVCTADDLVVLDGSSSLNVVSNNESLLFSVFKSSRTGRKNEDPIIVNQLWPRNVFIAVTNPFTLECLRNQVKTVRSTDKVQDLIRDCAEKSDYADMTCIDLFSPDSKELIDPTEEMKNVKSIDLVSKENPFVLKGPVVVKFSNPKYECLDWKNNNIELDISSEWKLFQDARYEQVKNVILHGKGVTILEGRRRIGKTFSVHRTINDTMNESKKIFYMNLALGTKDAVTQEPHINFMSAKSEFPQFRYIDLKSANQFIELMMWLYIKHDIAIILDEFQVMDQGQLNQMKVIIETSQATNPPESCLLLLGSHSYKTHSSYLSATHPLFAMAKTSLIMRQLSTFESFQFLQDCTSLDLRNRFFFAMIFDGVIGYYKNAFTAGFFPRYLYDSNEKFDPVLLEEIIDYFKREYATENNFSYLLTEKSMAVLKILAENSRDLLTPSEIAKDAPPDNLESQLNNLENFGFVGSIQGKQKSYFACDRSVITAVRLKEVEKYEIEEGYFFERFCRDMLKVILGSEWEMHNGFWQNSVEIDVIASKGNEYMVGSCKRSKNSHNFTKFLAHIVLWVLITGHYKKSDFSIALYYFSLTCNECDDGEIESDKDFYVLDETTSLICITPEKCKSLIEKTGVKEKGVQDLIRKVSTDGLVIKLASLKINHWNLKKLWENASSKNKSGGGIALNTQDEPYC